jgi:hypothetical protein
VQNYNFDGFYQFPVNICGQYRFAVVSDITLSGPGKHLDQFEFFLDRAVAANATEIIYINQTTMSHDDAILWPATGLTTWCLRPPAPNSHDRYDLVPAPPGFILSGRGVFRPIHLHYRHRRIQLGANGIHLIGGVLDHGHLELPSGGVEVNCGCFTIVELQLNGSGELLYQSTFWKPLKSGDERVTKDV